MSNLPPVSRGSSPSNEEEMARARRAKGSSREAAANDRALSALHAMAKPQPKAKLAPEAGEAETGAPAGGAGEGHAEEGPMSGASGFVGILARRQPGPGDSHMPLNDDEAKARRARYELHMAKEVGEKSPRVAPPHLMENPPLEIPPLVVPPAPAIRGLARRQTHAGTGPMQWVLGAMALVMFAIGVWAAGAIFYMQRVTPEAPSDVHYPLIRWAYDTTGASAVIGAYTRASVGMPWGMLLCLPVSLVIGALLVWTRRRGRR